MKTPKKHTLYLKKLRTLFPKRAKHSNKANVGSVLVVGGFKNFLGAGILSARSALVTGSGYSILMTNGKKQISKYPWMMFPDLIVKNPSLKFASDFLDKDRHALIIGPGLGVDTRSKSIFKNLLSLQQKLNFPMVVDADSFSLLANLKLMKKFSDTVVFTPHEGELARILKTTSKKVSENRVSAIIKAQEKWGGVWVLKGHETLVKNDGQFAILKNGSVALAKAGTGDVLSGVIGAFLAQGVSAFEASVLATYLHNEAAKQFLKTGDVLALSPLNLIENLPRALKKFRQQS